MAINPIQKIPKQTGGKGGLFGRIIGGIAGAIGGTFVGQPLAGASIGSTLGGMAGGAADPVKTTGTQAGPTPLETAGKLDPQVQLASLLDAQKAASSLPVPQADELNATFFNPAIEALRRRV